MVDSLLTYNLLDKYNEIAHFCTTRRGGTSMGNFASFNLSPFSGDKTEDVSENLNRLAKTLNIGPEKIIIPFQTHGIEIREIDEDFFKLNAEAQKAYLYGVDALFTQVPEICLGISTADCVPLQFFDPIKKAVAVAHAGWRGTCKRIAEKTIATLVETYNCNPSDIRVTIGPSISVSVYEIGQDVVTDFREAGFDLPEIFEERKNAFFLDLWKANRQSLTKAGILPANIQVAGICTFTEHNRFFSARRLGIKSGRMLSGIMLK